MYVTGTCGPLVQLKKGTCEEMVVERHVLCNLAEGKLCVFAKDLEKLDLPLLAQCLYCVNDSGVLYQRQNSQFD